MSATRPAGELREQAKLLILDKLKSISIAQASRDLKISREAIYGFKRGEYCPSLAIVERACKAWGLEFKALGMTVNSKTFDRLPGPTEPQPAEQLSFVDIWEKLENSQMTVIRSKKVKGAIEMTLRIAIPA
jgi:hypothetical protein